MKKKILWSGILFLWALPMIAQQTFTQRGQILSGEDDSPLSGASVVVSGTAQGVIADEDGQFSLDLSSGKHSLQISFIGFKTAEVEVEILGPNPKELTVRLSPDDYRLSEVQVLSTGYQKIPQERATGSFVQLDEELINRSVSPDLISRLRDVTSGLTVNPRAQEGEQLNIRGRSTLYANTQPLIILDNFPYDGPLDNINPNDIAEITVLKDAAAASIWGARAGNGVIVITTKSGEYNSPIRVSLTANTTIHESPDAFYPLKMSPAEFLEVEQLLFERNFYNSAFRSANKPPITPGVEILEAERLGEISSAEAQNQLQSLAGQDLREDINRYFYQPRLDQQYAVQVSGGGEKQRFGISMGYDATRENIVANDRNRITFKGNQEFKLWKNRLTVANQLAVIQSNRTERNNGPADLIFSGLTESYPYARMVDQNGRPLPIIRDYRRNFILQAEQEGLLNWEYLPLEEIGRSVRSSGNTEIRWTSGITAKINPDLQAELSYQYWSNQAVSTQEHSADSYFARNLINQYTQVGEDGSLSFPVARGAILNKSQGTGRSHQFRSLLRYEKTIGKSAIHALAGFEAKEYELERFSNRYYGYNPELASSIATDHLNPYSYYYNPGISRVIPSGEGIDLLADRFLSYYFNGGYTYDNTWDFTLSARRDQSNLFGVRSNQRGVPLYSLGTGWTISEMPFYTSSKLPYLKLRTSYGYNGNIDKSLTGETTALFLTSSIFGVNPGVPYARILNPPYPDLRWERIQIVNVGLDLEDQSGRISHTAEYFWKNGLDLISDTQLPPSSGLNSFRGNAANTRGQGMDIILNTRNLEGEFNWETQWLFSTNKERVSNYLLDEPVNTILRDGGFGAGPISPVEGYPVYPVFSYRWAGLDPDNGNPRGFLDGSPSDDFLSIIRSTEVDDLIYHGSAVPTVFGSIRNTLGYKGFSLSFNISYKLGYYYRRTSIRYADLLRAEPGHADYSSRWQNPGDERITDVPSLPASRNINRDNLYLFSEALVERGDHIRFQDIRLGYRFPSKPSSPFTNFELYSFINNVGMIWKASDDPLDPDFRSMKPLRSIAFGLRANF